jgi:hypothetical protein
MKDEIGALAFLICTFRGEVSAAWELIILPRDQVVKMKHVALDAATRDFLLGEHAFSLDAG